MKLRKSVLLVSVITLILLITVRPRAEWVKSPPSPQPDVDKSQPDMTCWLAAAANMLSGAGYGVGITPQERAAGIYLELKNHFGTVD